MTAIAQAAPAKSAKVAPATAPKAKEPKAAPAAPKEPKPADMRRVRVLVDHNPKKPTSQAFARFALYRDGQTVADALAAGVKSIDIVWDTRRKHIELLPPA